MIRLLKQHVYSPIKRKSSLYLHVEASLHHLNASWPNQPFPVGVCRHLAADRATYIRLKSLEQMKQLQPDKWTK